MTLKEKFENVEIMFESQIGILKYDELCESSNQCVKIADEFAIGFLRWYCIEALQNQKYLALSIFELLEIYKKQL